MKLILGLAVIFLIITAAASAQATIIQFSDRSSFISSSSALTNIAFDGPSYTYTAYPYGLTESGVNFSIDGPGYLYEIGPDYGPAWYNWGSGVVLSAQNSDEETTPGVTIHATLPSGKRAVGSDFMSFAPYISKFEITLANGSVSTFEFQSLYYPNRAFAGFISDTDIFSIDFHNVGAQFLNLDNFVFGDADLPVPEPSTLLLLGFGLVGLGAYRLNKRT